MNKAWEETRKSTPALICFLNAYKSVCFSVAIARQRPREGPMLLRAARLSARGSDVVLPLLVVVVIRTTQKSFLHLYFFLVELEIRRTES